MKDPDRDDMLDLPAAVSPTITVELEACEARALINAANLLIDTLAAVSEGNKAYALTTATMKLEVAVLIEEGE